MKTVRTFITEATETTRTVDYRVIHKDAVAYRVSSTTKRTTRRALGVFKETEETVSKEGFATEAILNKFLNGKSKTLSQGKGRFILVSQLFMDDCQRYGFGYAGPRQDSFYDSFEEFPKPLTSLESGASEDLVIRVDDHMIFGKDNIPHPVGIIFAVDNEHCDLEASLKILQAGEGVHFIPHGRDYSFSQEEPITDIPYYNATPERTRQMRFIYSLTREQYIKAWELANSYGSNYPSTEMRRAIAELGFLKLIPVTPGDKIWYSGPY